MNTSKPVDNPNRLLRAPRAEFEQLRPHLEQVHLRQGMLGISVRLEADPATYDIVSLSIDAGGAAMVLRSCSRGLIGVSSRTFTGIRVL